MQLRAYQSEAVGSIFRYWKDGGGNPLVEMATGTGKSLVIASLVERILYSYPGFRILMLVHVRELVEQNSRAMLRTWPQAPLGIFSAGLRRRDTASQVLFASVQSVYKRGVEIGKRDIVIIDEAHLCPKELEGMYQKLIADLRKPVPDLRVAGFTATPYRLDSGRLDEGETRLFHDTVYTYDIAQGVADGYLVPLRARGAKNEIDVSGVHKRGGEFIPKELEEAANKDAVVDGACEEICTYGSDRKSWLIFCTGVAHSKNTMERLRARGISAATVNHETPDGERDRIFAAFKDGRFRCLVGVQVFTTGFDAPNVDMIAMLRPTMSTGLYIQMLGRGTRPVVDVNLDNQEARLAAIKESTKPACLVLDFAGNVRRHGPVDSVVIKVNGNGDGTGDAPTKICPQCEYYCHAAALLCENCGFEWPIKTEPKHEMRADRDTPVMTEEIVAKWLDVSDVRVGEYVKSENAPHTMCVEYWCGYISYREWICFDHSGYPREKAYSWWRAMGGGEPPPRSVAEAVSRACELEIVTNITVLPDGRYWRINGYRLEKDGVVFEVDGKMNVKMKELVS